MSYYCLGGAAGARGSGGPVLPHLYARRQEHLQVLCRAVCSSVARHPPGYCHRLAAAYTVEAAASVGVPLAPSWGG